MKTPGIAIAGLCALFFCASSGAHPATERYIPVGYWASIGIGGTYVGVLTDVSQQGRSVSFSEKGATKSVRITEQTKIWIDRSHLGKKNAAGNRRDLKQGATTEIRMSEGAPGVAEWIKIRADR